MRLGRKVQTYTCNIIFNFFFHFYFFFLQKESLTENKKTTKTLKIVMFVKVVSPQIVVARTALT